MPAPEPFDPGMTVAQSEELTRRRQQQRLGQGLSEATSGIEIEHVPSIDSEDSGPVPKAAYIHLPGAEVHLLLMHQSRPLLDLLRLCEGPQPMQLMI